MASNWARYPSIRWVFIESILRPRRSPELWGQKHGMKKPAAEERPSVGTAGSLLARDWRGHSAPSPVTRKETSLERSHRVAFELETKANGWPH